MSLRTDESFVASAICARTKADLEHQYGGQREGSRDPGIRREAALIERAEQQERRGRHAERDGCVAERPPNSPVPLIDLGGA